MSKDVLGDDTSVGGVTLTAAENRRRDSAVTGKHTTTCSGFCQANT